ncbi:type II secretion system F family protein [Pedosphaera parvula]|uniref:Type II secretion system protein n=1 Tax=Pedosphaera parvula (strain Ellin514) TaxID=320771 RepID=B9XBW3_PEDPL|nr:type II secretion system F family protein [Pedosphaera parvula]EEF62431.1 type II secretion system protein [Pedosphaera parvula Ellin514]
MAAINTPSSIRKRAELYHQIAQLVASGIGLISALQLIQRNPPSTAFRKHIERVLEHLNHGSTFTDAMRATGSWLPSFDVYLIEAAENSGRLDSVFKMLGDYYADTARLQKQMLSDLAYPALVLHMAVFLFPLIDYFKNGSGALFLIKTAGVIVPLYAIIFGLLYAFQAERNEKWRASLERVLKVVPVFSTARHSLALARLAAALEALINAGVNIVPAWEMAAAASGSPGLVRTVMAWRARILGGQTPAEAIRLVPNQFPDVFTQLYTSGEISGQLDESLRRIYRYYEEQGRARMSFLASWVPRGLYMAIALFVGYKVITFYQGYINQIQQAGGF